MNQIKVGVVGGMGLMASPMAKHWKNSQHIQVAYAHDRGSQSERHTKVRQQWQSGNTQLVGDLTSVTDGVDGVFVCCGKNGSDAAIIAKLASSLGKDKFICHLSTVSANFVDEAAAFCSVHGVQYLNYPLTGGPVGAENATMLILASGPSAWYERLEPALSEIGQPKYFGDRLSAGAEVKLIGHLMVFNGMVGISSALAVHSERFNGGTLGGIEQTQFFDFLNGGAGGTKQWDIAARMGIADDKWQDGFHLRYALVDCIYAAKLCIDAGVSALAAQAIMHVALCFSFIVREHGPGFGTQALVREMIANKKQNLDAFVNKYVREESLQAQLDACIESLPKDLQQSVALNMNQATFQSAISA